MSKGAKLQKSTVEYRKGWVKLSSMTRSYFQHTVWFPENLMRIILHHIHYMPDHWKGAAHTTSVRDEFSNLFTYKITHLLSEVII